ncbi:MAG: hypothetical protein JWN51_3706, partial [Phycisphaerales bacterium]|nr:hypothetical protein [Phycisphaerales bacterium]
SPHENTIHIAHKVSIVQFENVPEPSHAPRDNAVPCFQRRLPHRPAPQIAAEFRWPAAQSGTAAPAVFRRGRDAKTQPGAAGHMQRSSRKQQEGGLRGQGPRPRHATGCRSFLPRVTDRPRGEMKRGQGNNTASQLIHRRQKALEGTMKCWSERRRGVKNPGRRCAGPGVKLREHAFHETRQANSGDFAPGEPSPRGDRFAPHLPRKSWKFSCRSGGR